MSQTSPTSPSHHVYGNLSPDAPQVVLYGNCQTVYMALLLAEADSRYQYVCLLNYTAPGQPLRLPEPESLQRCALYLEQFDFRDDGRLPVRMALRAILPPSCPRVAFPSFIFRSLWPFEALEERNAAEERYPWGRYPYGDRIVQEMAQEAAGGSTSFADYMRRSTASMPDLAQLLANEENRLLVRDQSCDVQIGDYVLDRFRRQHLFWTNAHVTADGLDVLGTRLYGAVQSHLGGDRLGGENRIHAFTATLAPMGTNQVPIHPLVAEAAGLAFWRSDLLYRWYDHAWTFEEYFQRYLAYDRSW